MRPPIRMTNYRLRNGRGAKSLEELPDSLEENIRLASDGENGFAERRVQTAEGHACASSSAAALWTRPPA